MAEGSIAADITPRRKPDDHGRRSTEQDTGGEAPLDRPADVSPEADDISENEPPIERSDGQVYGG